MNGKEKLSERKKRLKSICKQCKNLTNNNRGITLIALVITIIVLLILAGVTINLTLGENGIFRTAEMAGKNYTQAQEQELAGIENFNNEINNVIGGLGSGNGQGETSEPEEPELPENALKRVAKPGDYVKYDTGIEGIGDNGDGIVLFRVLYNDETNGLQIISDKNVEQVKLGDSNYAQAVKSYNGAIEELNNKAEMYVNNEYAYDGRSVGSAPRTKNGIFIDKDKVKFEGIDEYIEPSEENYVVLRFTNASYINSYDTDTNYTEDIEAMREYERNRRDILVSITKSCFQCV